MRMILGVRSLNRRFLLTIATGAAFLLCVAFTPRSATAGSPPAPAGCPGSTASFENTTAQPIEGLATTTSTITTSGLDTYL